MKQHVKHVITVTIVLTVLALGAGAFAYSGLYNIGADDAHTRPVYSMLEMVRKRSVTARAHKLHPPPNLNDEAHIRQGAGNYNAMCTGCHLAPGMAATELSKGLYPSPPNLSLADPGDPSHHFWVIKHGIKASGMPAWGRSMDDQYIWNMVAFVQRLPKLDATQYAALVATSGGHSRGGGESGHHHEHDEGMADHHMEAMQGMQGMDHHDQPPAETGAAAVSPDHVHADGHAHEHVEEHADHDHPPAS